VAHAVALGIFVEEADPGFIRCLARRRQRRPRQRDRARAHQAPQVVHARPQHAKAVAGEDVAPAPRRRHDLADQPDAREANQSRRCEPAGAGDDQPQAFQPVFEPKVR
jgi:hypothetical protein